MRAKALGYLGDDLSKIQVALFTPDSSGEICFADPEIVNDFLEFQIELQIISVEPYKTLLEKHPEARLPLIDISKRILNDEEVDAKEILNLFPTQ